jgi:hypothetical protein
LASFAAFSCAFIPTSACSASFGPHSLRFLEFILKLLDFGSLRFEELVRGRDELVRQIRLFVCGVGGKAVRIAGLSLELEQFAFGCDFDRLLEYFLMVHCQFHVATSKISRLRLIFVVSSLESLVCSARFQMFCHETRILGSELDVVGLACFEALL